MTELNRAFADVEVRASAEGRTIAGIVVPFDREARVSDGGPAYTERFAAEAFDRVLGMGGPKVPLLSQHRTRENPLGVSLPDTFRKDSAGLYGEFKVSKTRDGDEVLELVRDGALGAFSVGFKPIRERKEGKTVVRTEVALREVSVVTFPAYEDARIQSVREALAHMTDEERVELLRMYGEAHDLAPEIPATTADERSEQTPDETDPASATPDVTAMYRSLRRKAREMGAI